VPALEETVTRAPRSRSLTLALVVFATFTDTIAYSVAVPILPDLTRRLGASATTVGLLFAAFGVTLLAASIPAGAVSDRVGRRGPLVGALVTLAVATLAFAFADSLAALFVARLAQGAADAITWVAGLALIADVYPSSERGRATGIIMSGASASFIVGPSLGGWLYEIGGMRLPFLVVTGMAAAAAIAALAVRLPPPQISREQLTILAVLRVPAVRVCVAVTIVAAATIAMLEPVVALQLQRIGVNPARIGLVFGISACVAALLHPLTGRLADVVGARRLMLWGLIVSGCVLPLLGWIGGFHSAVAIDVIETAALALVITPSLSYMGEAASSTGPGSFGVGYGLYNMAWGVGLLVGPALGGFLFDRIGLATLALWWAPAVIALTLSLMQIRASAPAASSSVDYG
jgi:multidrug resistance protein